MADACSTCNGLGTVRIHGRPGSERQPCPAWWLRPHAPWSATMSARRIWKFDLLMGQCKVQLPAGYRLLSFGMQSQGPVIWAEVDPSRPTVEAAFDIIPTGYGVPDGGTWVGTVQDGPFVWHLYQLAP